MDAEEVFQMLDTDGTGTVSKEAFLSQWKKLQQRFSPEKRSPVAKGGAKKTTAPAPRGTARASAASATSTPVESHAEPRRRTKSSYSYAPDHNDSSKLDPVFFRSFDLSNDDDVVYSPAKPERYIKLDYNWSLTPRKKGDRFADEYPDEPIGRSGDDRPPASGSAKQQHRSDGEDDDDSDDDEIIPRPQSSSSDTSTSSRHSRPQSVSPRSSGAKSGDARRQELIGQLQTRSKLRKPGSWREDPVRAPSTKSSVDDDQNEDEDDEDSSDSEPQEF